MIINYYSYYMIRYLKNNSNDKIWLYLYWELRNISRVLNTTVNLYMVKNIDKWQDSSNFNKETDAVLIATVTTGANKSGYFETNIVYSTNNGYDIRTGAIEDYSECRYYVEDTQAVNKTAGIISIKYY